MAVALGLLVALFYGSGDFFGGLGSKRSTASAVVVGSFAISGVCLAVVTLGWAALGDPPTPAGRDLVLGAAAGVVGPVALGLLYRGLAIGRMAVVAPTTAVVAAVVPFAWGLLEGERPPPVAIVGVLVALVAVGLISAAPAHPDDAAPVPSSAPRGRGLVATALASGLGFGVIFVLLGSTTEDAGLWPLLVARPVAVAVAAAGLLWWARRRGTDPRPALVPAAGSWALVAATGVLDTTANGLYLAATQRGLLSIVAVLSSLYPASTVVLARVVLGERLHIAQVVGLALATAGVVAMAAA
ncbi:MAG TPA: DMT family transporter [Aquihabitans sp.]|nr:DMT family transporter [Aquihabitans sp.]